MPSSTDPSTAVAPLKGVRVLCLGTYLAGPLTTTHLAQLGASVTAVERPDDARGAKAEAAWRPSVRDALRANKVIVQLDLRTTDGRLELHRLLQSADVVVTNFSAATLRRHGLDATSCRRVRPGIVHCWLPGFAEADDEAPAPAWEAVILASSGVFRDMGLNRRLLGVAASYSPLPLASAYASVLAALAVCAALYRDAARGVGIGEGEGDAITVPLASALCETLCHNSLELQKMPDAYLDARRARRAGGGATRRGARAACAARTASSRRSPRRRRRRRRRSTATAATCRRSACSRWRPESRLLRPSRGSECVNGVMCVVSDRQVSRL